MKQVSRPNSSYHNTLVKWIKEGLLIKSEVLIENHRSQYNSKTKTYLGLKQPIKVLRLYFRNNKSYFVREQYIDEYLKLIQENNFNI